jgi:phage-related protein
MPDLTYNSVMRTVDRPPKPLAWLHGEIKTPPFTAAARLEAGALLRRLQVGESLGMPHSRPMPSLGPRCHELRVRDEDRSWRLIYRLDSDAIVIADVFAKTTRQTPKAVINDCQRRLRAYDEAVRDEAKGSGIKGG